MREVLFRGKRLEDGTWVEGYYAKATDMLNDEEVHIIFNPELELFPRSEFGTFDEVDPDTVGQCTGMRDKTDKRIFEDDIVKIKLSYGEGYNTRRVTGAIKYDADGNLGVIIEYIDDIPVWSNILFELNLSGAIEEYCFEIIGNIHDNPELLEV